MTRAHDAAVFARLRSDPQLAEYVFDGAVKERPQRYVVVWVSGGLRSGDRFDGGQRNITKTYTIHSVGMSAEQARAVNERVMGLLVDFRPQVPNRKCQRLKHEVSRPVQMDTDVSPPLYYLVDQFDLFSVPFNPPPIS